MTQQAIEPRIKMGEGLRQYHQKLRREKAEKLITQLKAKGVSRVTDLDGYYSRLVTQYFPDTFMKIYVRWAGLHRGNITKSTRFFKHGFLGKTFLGLRNDRTAIVRFFMEIFKDKKYSEHDIKAITRWLKNWLSKAEIHAVVWSLGFRYKGDHCSNRSLRNIRINGYHNHKEKKNRD